MTDREQQNLRNLEAGGVTVAAEERLRAQAARPKPFWVSNLSVNELSLIRRAGFYPLGQVMGCSAYHVGFQWPPGMFGYPQSVELETLTKAHLHARDLAIERLLFEAKLLGAHGVVGVRFDRQALDSGGLLDFNVIGTAVRMEGAPPTETPFTSDLTGEEVYQLWTAGYRPVGFAYGNCYWYEVASWNTRMATDGGLFGGWSNEELPDFTKAVASTRDTAVGRMEAECRKMGADGVVGVQIDRQIQTVLKDNRHDLTVHMQVTGTAIAQRSGDFAAPPHRMAVSLADLPIRKAAEAPTS